MNATTYAGRIAAGRAAERRLLAALTERGFQVVRTGQETWLPPSFYQPLRGRAGDGMARALRHVPDFLAQRRDFPPAYWDAKRNSRAGTAFFALEQSFLDEQRARVAKGERVVVAFCDTDGRLYANWVEQLAVMAEIRRFKSEWTGSWSPFVLIGRGSARPLDEFIAANRIRPGRAA